MHGRQSLATSTEASTTGAPIPQDYSATVSAVSAVFSLLALGLAVGSYRRSGKVERLNKFEREYGSELRELSRGFDDEIAELNAFIVPSGSSLDQQKGELAGAASDLEDRSSKISRLLGELDEDEKVAGNTWEADFLKWTSSAEAKIGEALEIARSQPLLFARAVGKAQDDYRSAIRSLRKKIRRVV